MKYYLNCIPIEIQIQSINANQNVRLKFEWRRPVRCNKDKSKFWKLYQEWMNINIFGTSRWNHRKWERQRWTLKNANHDKIKSFREILNIFVGMVQRGRRKKDKGVAQRLVRSFDIGTTTKGEKWFANVLGLFLIFDGRNKNKKKKKSSWHWKSGICDAQIVQQQMKQPRAGRCFPAVWCPRVLENVLARPRDNRITCFSVDADFK